MIEFWWWTSRLWEAFFFTNAIYFGVRLAVLVYRTRKKV